MERWGRWGVLSLVVVFAGVFAYLNAGERTTIYLGFTVLYRVSLVGLIFVAFLLGMVVMFLVGLRHDLRVRRLLREYRIEEQAPPSWSSGPPPDPYP